MSDFETEVSSGQRFEFGKNWRSFLSHLTDERIKIAEYSLREKLKLDSLEGLRFLDAGNGSGLFSLAARRLGARVRSFDFDPNSVECARELKRRYFPDDPDWEISRGSVLNESFLASLGEFDVTYCWGVLHHTGDMWKGMELVSKTVKPGGKYYIMIYRDRGWSSRLWWHVKRFYCSGRIQRLIALSGFVTYAATKQFLTDILARRNPIAHYRDYKEQRGMSRYHDWVDWIGGFPYEYATPEEVIGYCKELGFELSVHDVNQYVFVKLDS